MTVNQQEQLVNTIDGMLLLSLESDESFSPSFFDGDDIPPYAILFHTWGSDSEEITFQNVENRVESSKPGYHKLRFCQQQTA
jgi:hypothetical protein